MNAILKKMTYQSVIDHLFASKSYWYAGIPGIYDELAKAILEAKKQTPDLHLELVIDPKEKAFRSHLGDIDAVSELLYEGIILKEIPNHRLGFIISEHSAWFLFIQSRAIEKEPIGYNAIRMSSITKNELLLHFFRRTTSKDFNEEYINERRELDKIKEQITEHGMTEFTPAPIDEDELDYVDHTLEHNPPPSPDFKRIYDVYSTKIKFVEFEVNGIKFHQKTISIPSDILNLVDENLRNQISTRLHLFDKSSKEKIRQKLSLVENKVDNIRDNFLKRVTSRKKNVIRAVDLKSFNERIEVLKETYCEVQEEVEKDIRSSLISIKKRLKEELLQNFRQSPPEKLRRFKGDDQFELFLEDYVNEVVAKFSMPTPESLMNSFDISKRIFDPTFNDFKDKDFISELVQIGFIKDSEKAEIVDVYKAIGVQPNER